MNVGFSFKRLARPGLLLTFCYFLLPSPAPAEISLNTALNNNQMLYSAFRNTMQSAQLPMGSSANTKDAALLTAIVQELTQAITNNQALCNEIDYLKGGNGCEIRQLFSAGQTPVIRLNVAPHDSINPNARAVSNANGTTLFSETLATSGVGRWNALAKTTTNYAPPLDTAEHVWLSQIKSTFFHEMGHCLLLHNYDIFTSKEIDNFLSYGISQFKDVHHHESIVTLDEAFSVYCQYLYYRDIEKRPHFNLSDFMDDTLNNKGKKYGISVDYMWRYVVSLDYQNFNNQQTVHYRPRKELYDSFVKKDLIWGKGPDWEKREKIVEILSMPSDAQKMKTQQQKIYAAMTILTAHQQANMSTPALPQLQIPLPAATSTK